MNREQEEMVQRLTARYVSEFRSGLQPQLSEYVSCYPQYADRIADFVTYYHAIELDIPSEGEIIPPLSHAAHAALDEAWENVLHYDLGVNNTLDSLHVAAQAVHKSFLQVALEIDLGQDILKKLDQHRIDAASIPQEVCRRLATVLHQPVAVIEMYLGLGKQKQGTQYIAESRTSYRIEDILTLHSHMRSFQEAVEQSRYMSKEQKRDWQAILLDEDLL
jgi:hypothetical protein